MSARRILTIKIVVEGADEASMPGLVRFCVQAIKSAFRNIRNGSVAVGVYDEGGNLLGVDMTPGGSPSEEMLEIADDLFGDYVSDLEPPTGAK